MEYPEFKVCVRCFTYNQSQYITDALNGFVMQETDFPFVCCVVDDASTDGEQEVIRRYVEDNFDMSDGSCYFKRETDFANILYAQHKTNSNCYFAVLFLKENHDSIRKSKMPYLTEWRDVCEYKAFCEGDDYWIDSKKLQKQVNFLDDNPSVGLCYTNFGVYYDDSGILIEDAFRFRIFNKILDFKSQLVSRGYIAPPTWLYRKKVLDSLSILDGTLDGSFCISLDFFGASKVECLDDVTAIYRLHRGSASCGLVSIKKIVLRNFDLLKIQLHYSNKYRGYFADKNELYNYTRDFYRWYVDHYYALTVIANSTDILSIVNEKIIKYRLFSIKILVVYVLQNNRLFLKYLINRYHRMGYVE